MEAVTYRYTDTDIQAIYSHLQITATPQITQNLIWHRTMMNKMSFCLIMTTDINGFATKVILASKNREPVW